MALNHIPVLLAETLTYLNPQPHGRYVDGTLGGGGHTKAILDASSPTGQLLAVDRDPGAVDRFATEIANTYGPRFNLRVGSYEDLPDELQSLGWSGVDGILLDLGLSSIQLAETARGFSFQGDGILDLRFDPTRGEPAYQLLDRWSVEELGHILGIYGELRSPWHLAKQILIAHRAQSILTTQQFLAASRLQHPRKRAQLFQALRIVVNDELGTLERALPKLWEQLLPGGRFVILTFQSLEDRIIKQQFRAWAVTKTGTLLTKKSITPQVAELAGNPRARSAKLRAIEKQKSA
ncbi:16S rRNA (cytosine(1402)-N(4))-methyltransferase RsmH [Candidatus Berkelbacteria bacterium]|nr:16S rRNA (cytosine(1402)-N(4))-methyltransferase RsmH [Candidatus Berkelbacteria bacterium]